MHKSPLFSGLFVLGMTFQSGGNLAQGIGKGRPITG